MSRHDTYQVAVNGMALDVTITMVGEEQNATIIELIERIGK